MPFLNIRLGNYDVEAEEPLVIQFLVPFSK
jgi:hypothetical protein